MDDRRPERARSRKGNGHGIRPEKAFHFNLEWTHTFSPRYRLECQLYQKNYFDLAVPLLINTGRLDWTSDLLKHQDGANIQSLPKAR